MIEIQVIGYRMPAPFPPHSDLIYFPLEPKYRQTNLYTYIHIYIYVCINTCIFMYTYTYSHTYVYAYTYIYIRIYRYAYMSLQLSLPRPVKRELDIEHRNQHYASENATPNEIGSTCKSRTCVHACTHIHTHIHVCIHAWINAPVYMSSIKECLCMCIFHLWVHTPTYIMYEWIYESNIKIWHISVCVKPTTYEQLSCNHERRMPLGKRRDSIAWEKTKPAKNRYRYEITLMIHNQVQTEQSGKEGGKFR